MKLYDSKVAPNPRRVRIFLAEKGIEVPTVQVDIGSGENRKPPYIDKNPLGGTPMLELDDGTCIAETVAICRYFEATQPNPPLMGTDARDQAVVEMWQRRMELELFRYVTGCFQNTHDFFGSSAFRVGHFRPFSGLERRKHRREDLEPEVLLIA